MKTSKNSLNWITIALFVANISLLGPLSMAQRAQGIYLSANNYYNDSLSFCSTPSHLYRIKFCNSNYHTVIKITYNKSTIKVKKDSLYGYKDVEGNVYRFFHHEAYTIINKDTSLTLYKKSNTTRTKYEQETYNYFFSKGISGPIQMLSKYCLENAFNNNSVFIAFINLYFKWDYELPEYDTNHNTYKINYVFKLSNSIKNHL